MTDPTSTAREGAPSDELTALRAENERLRNVLSYAVEKYGEPGGPWNVPSEPGTWIAKARAALAQKEG